MSTWFAAVLSGGASQRMGSDKALVELHGRPLVDHVRCALEHTPFPTFERCSTIGGDRARLARVGWDHVADLDPGSGPLGGLCSALDAARGFGCDRAFVTTCDAPFVDGATISCLADCLDTCDEVEAVVAETEVGSHPLPVAIRVSTLGRLYDLFGRGERRLRAALSTLELATVEVEARLLVDLDTPDEVAWAHRLDRPSG